MYHRKTFLVFKQETFFLALSMKMPLIWVCPVVLKPILKICIYDKWVKSSGHIIKSYEQNKERKKIVTKDEVNLRLLFFSENTKPCILFRNRWNPLYKRGIR